MDKKNIAISSYNQRRLLEAISRDVYFGKQETGQWIRTLGFCSFMTRLKKNICYRAQHAFSIEFQKCYQLAPVALQVEML